MALAGDNVEGRRARRRWLRLLLPAAAVGLSIAWALWQWWVPEYRPGLQAGERYGVDVSNHQGSIDWERVAGDGVDFAYIKSTEGGDFVDAYFADNWAAARAAGVDVGAYHFFTLCRPAEDQVANFLATVPVDEADLPAALDLELAGNCSQRPERATLEAEIRLFIDQVEEATGQPLLLYVGPEFHDRYGTLDVFDERLWHRSLWNRPDGDRWAIWQFTYRAAVDGIDGGVDLNIGRI